VEAVNGLGIFLLAILAVVVLFWGLPLIIAFIGYTVAVFKS
jgi:hypothetical protein